MTRVAVIGAGPAGLTAAYELAKHGLAATVFEADDQVGGLSRTVRHRGYGFDIGGHRFFTKSAKVAGLWHELLGDDLLLRPRLSRIRYRDHYFDYPLKPINALRGLGAVEALRVCASYASARLAPQREERTFEQWVTNRFGRRLHEIFFKTYTEKVWGIPCDEISSDWAAQRIRNLSLAQALRNAVFGNGRDGSGSVITTLIEQFHYPRLGPGMMWERCAERIVGQGGTVRLGARVARIGHRSGRVVSIALRDGAQRGDELDVDELISTMPLRQLVRALDPTPPDAVREAAERLRYRDYLAVNLIVARAEVFPDNWIYVHSPDVRVGRIQNYKNWSAAMVPDPQTTSLGLEYFLWQRDPEWHWPDERLIEQGVDECARLGLIRAAEVMDAIVVRVPKAYPVYDHGYGDNVAVIRDYLRSLANLQTVGRNGQHRYNNQDHSMLAGLCAADNVRCRLEGLSAENDPWCVNTDEEYHEESSAPGGDRLVPLPLLRASGDAEYASSSRAGRTLRGETQTGPLPGKVALTGRDGCDT